MEESIGEREKEYVRVAKMEKKMVMVEGESEGGVEEDEGGVKEGLGRRRHQVLIRLHGSTCFGV